MKTTLFLLISLSGLALASDSLTYTTVNASTAAHNGGNGYYGFTLALGNQNFMTSTSGGETVALPETVTLDTLSFLTRFENGSGNDLKIAIYTYTNDGTVGELVGLSNNSTGTYANNTNYTLDFSGVELDTSLRYQYMFVSADSTVESLTPTEGSGDSYYSLYNSSATNNSLAMSNNGADYGTSGIPGGWGTYKSSSINSWEGMYLPVVSFGTSVSVIPEPATATLSLLALAGLCARRRRKA